MEWAYDDPANKPRESQVKLDVFLETVSADGHVSAKALRRPAQIAAVAESLIRLVFAKNGRPPV
jgi:hypothetical protein